MPSDRHIMVIEAGTTVIWCHVLNQTGRIIESASTPWAYQNVEEISPYAREFDTNVVWDRLCALIRLIVSGLNSGPQTIAAIAATSQRQGVAFLDRNGHDLYAGPNLDLRAVFEGAAIDEENGSRFYEVTGHSPSFLFTASKLKWFQTHRSKVYDSISTALPLSDWLAWKLTGQLASEETAAGEAGLLDIRRRDWCTEFFSDLRLSTNQHVPLSGSGTVLGTVRTRVSKATGIPPSTPVIAAGADTQCGLLGMGLTQPGSTGIVAGWSAPVQMITDRPMIPPDPITWTGCYLTRQGWVLESNPGDTGNTYRWVADTFWSDADHRFQAMGRSASDVLPGSEGVLTFLGSSRMNMNSLGLRAGGLLFPVPMTMNEPSRAHLTRATLEAIAYAVKSNLHQVEATAGQSATQVALGGGMTKTKLWADILANVLNREITISREPQVSARGAFLCAMTGIGEFFSLEEAAASAETDMDTMKPEPLLALEYDDHYQRWQEIESGLKEVQI